MWAGSSFKTFGTLEEVTQIRRNVLLRGQLPYIHLALLNFSIEAGNLLCGNGALRAMVVGAFARVCGIDVDRLGALSVGAYLVSPTTP